MFRTQNYLITLSFLALVFTAGSLAAQPSQTEVQIHKLELEANKFELEIDKLELEILGLKQSHSPQWWNNSALIGLLAGIIGAATTLFVGHKTRQGGLDQATHETRLKAYSSLQKHTAPLAIYFPKPGADGTATLTPDICRVMGQALSGWFFANGFLLTEDARDSYFRFSRALTLAAQADSLAVPVFPRDEVAISKETVDEWRGLIWPKGLDYCEVEKWVFGSSSMGSEPHIAFKDFLILQAISSALRSALTKDLNSRRPPD
ncbi:MAG: hypothetical protein GY952_06850 [Rhodobacteraceae bacterium]|nr:hypothetical protein [Paracoccaceae bacterium]